MEQSLFIYLADAIATVAFGAAGSDEDAIWENRINEKGLQIDSANRASIQDLEVPKREDDFPEGYAEAQRLRDAKLKDAANRILGAHAAGKLNLFRIRKDEEPRQISAAQKVESEFLPESTQADRAVARLRKKIGPLRGRFHQEEGDGKYTAPTDIAIVRRAFEAWTSEASTDVSYEDRLSKVERDFSFSAFSVEKGNDKEIISGSEEGRKDDKGSPSDEAPSATSLKKGQKSATEVMKIFNSLPSLPQRPREVVYNEIGERVGLGVSRVKQIINGERRRQAKDKK